MATQNNQEHAKSVLDTAYAITAFTYPKTGKPRNALAIRFGKHVGVEVNPAHFLAGLSPEVLRDLLLEALQAKARLAVKKLNPDTCSAEEIQAAMQAKLDEIRQGKGVGGKAKPKMSEEVKQTRAEARQILRQALRERHEASGADTDLDPKAVTARISEMFKIRDAYSRKPGQDVTFTRKVDDESVKITVPANKAEAVARTVDNALNTAAERIKQRTSAAEGIDDDLLGELATKPKAKPAAKKPASKGKGKGKSAPNASPAA